MLQKSVCHCFDPVYLLPMSIQVKVQCQKGIPASLRAKCWPLLCGATDRMKQNENLYKVRKLCSVCFNMSNNSLNNQYRWYMQCDICRLDDELLSRTLNDIILTFIYNIFQVKMPFLHTFTLTQHNIRLINRNVSYILINCKLNNLVCQYFGL